MGNEQSNENTRKRPIHIKPKPKENARMVSFNVTRKLSSRSFTRLYVDGYIVYKDENYKYIDLDNSFPVAKFAKSDSIFIDLNYTAGYDHTKTFGIEEGLGLIGMTNPMTVWKDSENNIRDSNGNIISDTLGLVSSVGEIIGERQKFVASIEQSRYANNHA